MTTPDPFVLAPRGEGRTGAVFWPDTFFVDLSAYQAAFADLPPDAEPDDGAWLAGGAHVHEATHWVQTVGTSFGRLLAHLKGTTGDIGQAILASASRRDIEILLDGRRRDVAPAARSRTGRLLADRGLSSDTTLLIEHWWMGHAVEHLLMDGGASLPFPRDPALVVGLMLRYVRAGARIGTVFSAPDEDLATRTRRHGPRGEWPRTRLGLSARHIEEAAAMSSQHLYEARGAQYAADSWGPAFARVRRRRMKGVFRSPDNLLYTAAIRSFYSSSARLRPLTPERTLELFLLACDIALNPAIDLSQPSEQTWSDLLPGARFESLLDAMSDFTPDDTAIGDTPPESWWTSERERLTTHAGISDGSKELTLPPLLDAAEPSELPNECIRRFVAEASRNVREVRRRIPSALASVVYAAEPRAQVGLAALEREAVGPGLHPPLQFGLDGAGRTSLDDAGYDRILEAVTRRRAVWSWLVAARPLEWRGLPSDGFALELRTLAAQSLPS